MVRTNINFTLSRANAHPSPARGRGAGGEGKLQCIDKVFKEKTMKKVLYVFLCLFISGNVHAALNVFACEPEWAALTQQLAGNQANIYTATGPLQDPHQ